MYRYLCCGLTIESEMHIPELVSADHSDADVRITYGEIEELPTPSDEIGSSATREENGTITYWLNKLGGIKVTGGHTIVAHPLPGIEETGFRFLVSGIGIGFVLHQRGMASLHASGAAIDGEAVAFIGWKRMGKSSTAAAFHARSFPVVTDDVLPVYFKDDTVVTAPAFPHLKLWPESVRAVFGEDPTTLPHIHPDGVKRTRSVADGFPDRDLPLRCVYVLDWLAEDEGDEVRIDELSTADALMHLMRHSFALRMLGKNAASGEHLRHMASLASRLHVRHLRRPVDVNRIDDVVTAVLEDLSRLADPGVTVAQTCAA